MQRKPGKRRLLVALFVAFPFFFTGSCLYVAPTHIWLRIPLARLPVPEDAQLIGEEKNGNFICFDECSSVSRSYLVPGDEATIRKKFLWGLKRAGWEVFRDPDFGDNTIAYRGRYELQFSVGHQANVEIREGFELLALQISYRSG